MDPQLTFLVLAALLGATLSGVLGMGGGTLLLALMLLTDLDPAVVIPIHAGVQWVSNITRVVAHLGHIKWKPALILMAAALPGPMLGLWLAESIDREFTRALIGVVIVYSVWAPKWGVQKLRDTPAFAAAGVIGGTMGVVTGAVGPLLAPFFLRPGFPKQAIIGTKAVSQSFLHIIKIAAFSGLYPAVLARTPQAFDFGAQLWVLAPMGAAAIIGTYAGKWLLLRVSEKRFVTLYKVSLTLLAGRLIVSPWL